MQITVTNHLIIMKHLSKQYYTIFLKTEICPNVIINATWDINKHL